MTTTIINHNNNNKLISFSMPTLEVNEEGWGPSTKIEKMKDIPYFNPFNKGDKLGKLSDWQQQNQPQQHQGKNKQYQKDIRENMNYFNQEDETNFQLVDNTKIQTKKFGKKNQFFFSKNLQQQLKMKYKATQKQVIKNIIYTKGKWGQDQNSSIKKREPSITIKTNWHLIQNIDFNTLSKLQLDKEPEAEDLKNCGFIEYYNKDYDRISTRTEKLLERTDKIFYNVTTSNDPILKNLSLNNMGTIFATDNILSHLMACTRTVFPWDLTIIKNGNNIFFDKRDGSLLDYISMNETATEPPVDDGKESINSLTSLLKEATVINQNFSQQVLDKNEKPFQFENPNPFQKEKENIAVVGYKYRRWNLSDEIKLVSRCEIDGITKDTKGKNLFLTIKAINEFDPKTGIDWRKVIDTQRGAILATELKNNSVKLAKWTAQSLMAGTDNIKLGFISRMSPRDNSTHVILAVQDYKPKEFATTINLNIKNAWAILKYIIEILQKQMDGKYILMRDPEKSVLLLYSVPLDEK